MVANNGFLSQKVLNQNVEETTPSRIDNCSNLNPKVLPKEIESINPFLRKKHILIFFCFLSLGSLKTEINRQYSLILHLTRCDLDFTTTNIKVFTSFGKQKRLA